MCMNYSPSRPSPCYWLQLEIEFMVLIVLYVIKRKM
jgi:hypothetical protein